MTRLEWIVLLVYAVLIILIPDHMWKTTALVVAVCFGHMFWLFHREPTPEPITSDTIQPARFHDGTPITAETLESMMWDAEVTLNEPNSDD